VVDEGVGIVEILDYSAKGVLMVRMNRVEALKTIESLTAQIIDNSANARRWEYYAKKGRKRIDFSISVTPEDPS